MLTNHQKNQKALQATLDTRQLINADIVIKYVDNAIHYSNSGTRLYIPLENVDYQLESPEVTAYVKSNIVDVNIPIMLIDGISYVDFEFFKKISLSKIFI